MVNSSRPAPSCTPRRLLTSSSAGRCSVCFRAPQSQGPSGSPEGPSATRARRLATLWPKVCSGPDEERTRLKTYVERFNAHDFDAVRAMLAEDVRLEVVNRVRVEGKNSVAPYFRNYAARPQLRLIAGF